MTHLVLITGARVIADTEAARAWCARELDDVFGHSLTHSIAVMGDAPGPDTIGFSAAYCFGMDRVVYSLDGLAYHWMTTDPYQRPDSVTGSYWTREPVPVTSGERYRWPLLRNAAMVERVAKAVRERRATAVAHAFHAPWATTRGTAHTAKLCERGGIRVVPHACPPELGPSQPRPLPQ